MHFKVSAVLPLPAEIFFVERDSAAFRSLVAKVRDSLTLHFPVRNISTQQCKTCVNRSVQLWIGTISLLIRQCDAAGEYPLSCVLNVQRAAGLQAWGTRDL